MCRRGLGRTLRAGIPGIAHWVVGGSRVTRGHCCAGRGSGASSREGRPHLLRLSAAMLEWTPRTCRAAPMPELSGDGPHMIGSPGRLLTGSPRDKHGGTNQGPNIALCLFL